jgi:hypothetical protein
MSVCGRRTADEGLPCTISFHLTTSRRPSNVTASAVTPTRATDVGSRVPPPARQDSHFRPYLPRRRHSDAMGRSDCLGLSRPCPTTRRNDGCPDSAGRAENSNHPTEAARVDSDRSVSLVRWPLRTPGSRPTPATLAGSPAFIARRHGAMSVPPRDGRFGLHGRRPAMALSSALLNCGIARAPRWNPRRTAAAGT